MGGGETEGTAGRPESVRPPSAEELERKWLNASWYDPLRDPSNLYDGLNHRLSRAISWLRRAEQEVEDCDAKFIFCWIAFNAMYGRWGLPSGLRDDDYESERATFEKYLQKVSGLESERISDVMRNLSSEIASLLDNKYVFEPFWKHHNGLSEYSDWEQRFRKRKRERESAPWYKRTETTLCQLFDRLYALRNQLLHGGATWDSSVNRHQVTAGAKIMAALTPHFIDVMIRHPDGPQPVRDGVAAGAHAGGWGAPRYPVVREVGPQSGWTNGA